MSDYKTSDRDGTAVNEKLLARIAELTTQLEKTQAEREQLVAVLREIADPLGTLYCKAQAEGKDLDALTAILLTQTPTYLCGIAREALVSLPFITKSEPSNL